LDRIQENKVRLSQDSAVIVRSVDQSLQPNNAIDYRTKARDVGTFLWNEAALP
jgi:hypothetical protein